MTATTVTEDHLVRAVSLSELRVAGRLVARVDGHTMCLFADARRRARRRQPLPAHGLPASPRHASRTASSPATGTTPVSTSARAARSTSWPTTCDGSRSKCAATTCCVDVAPRGDPASHTAASGCATASSVNIPLVLAKATIALTAADPSARSAFRAGLDVRREPPERGWGPRAHDADVLHEPAPAPRPGRPCRCALYHGPRRRRLESRMATPPRFPLDPLPSGRRRACAAEALVPAVRRGARRRGRRAGARVGQCAPGRSPRRSPTCSSPRPPTIATSTSVTRSTSSTRRSRRSTSPAGNAPRPCSPRCRADCAAERMEESNAWRNPDRPRRPPRGRVRTACPKPCSRRRSARRAGRVAASSSSSCSATIRRRRRGAARRAARRRDRGGAGLRGVLRGGARIARFPTTNEFGDWDTALHTFTFANAVEQGLRRSPSVELLRGVFDAAMSIYLDRFLNVPADAAPASADVDATRTPCSTSFRTARPAAAGRRGRRARAHLPAPRGEPARLVAALGAALVREDRNFHTIQCFEAAVRQFDLLRGTEGAELPLIAAARYLAAHATTTRSQRQTFDIAHRLHRGERLYELDAA